MKKTLILWSSVALLAACQSNKSSNRPTMAGEAPTESAAPTGFRIAGTVQSAPAEGWVYLEEYEATGVRRMDSTQVDAQGQFALEGQVPESGFYRLNLFDAQYATLVLDNEQVQIQADASQPEAPVRVEGSPGTRQYQRVDSLREAITGRQMQLQRDFQTAMQGNNAQQQAAIQAEFEAMMEENTRVVKQMIDTMGATLPTLYATNFLDPENELDYLVGLAERFEREKPDSRHTREFASKVRQRQQQMNTGAVVGKPAPDIRLATPEGKEMNLSELRGKFVLIDFWASWCGPCRKENPNVVRMYERFKDKDFEIFGVSLDQDRDKWLKAIEKDQLTWPHVSDLKGWQSVAAGAYGVRAIPATFLVDKDGTIIAKNLRGPALEKKLEEVL